jgi:hypothetical protein
MSAIFQGLPAASAATAEIIAGETRFTAEFLTFILAILAAAAG